MIITTTTTNNHLVMQTRKRESAISSFLSLFLLLLGVICNKMRRRKIEKKKEKKKTRACLKKSKNFAPFLSFFFSFFSWNFFRTNKRTFTLIRERERENDDSAYINKILLMVRRERTRFPRDDAFSFSLSLFCSLSLSLVRARVVCITSRG